MAFKNLIILQLTMILFVVVAPYDNNLQEKLNMWESLRPGALLHALDQITAEVQYIESPLVLAAASTALPTTSTNLPITSIPIPPPTKLVQIQRRVSSNSAENQYSTEDHLNTDASGEFDYDKAYDQFVQQYFNTEKKSALNNDDEDEKSDKSIESHESFYNSDYEDQHSEPWTAASKKAPKEKCKKIKRNRQECVICKNLRNNEQSETCSYSTETEPETYAFKQQKSYKKQKDNNNDDVESDEIDDAQGDGEKAPIKKVKTKRKETTKKPRGGEKRVRPSKARKSHEKHPRGRNTEKRKDTSSCIKTVHRHKICYDCHNTDGEEFVRCYDKSTRGNANRARTEEEVQKSEKKIYKRMVSYSYAKGKDFTDSVGKKSKTTERSPGADKVQRK